MKMRKAIIVTLALFFACVIVARPVTGQVSIVGDTRSLNGLQIYYELAGAGPPLLLLHRFGGCTKSWLPHREQLAQHYRLIIPDLRGHGRSTNPAGEFTHRQAAHDIFALLDELGFDRVIAMGMSSGGMTLIHMATQQPERIEAMVLIGATSQFPQQARAIMQKAVPETMGTADLEEWRACSSRGDEQTREVIGQFYKMKDSYDDMNFTAPYLSTISARTLIIHGDRDEFFPVSIPVQMYDAIPDSYLWIIPNGGHIPIFDDKGQVFRDTALAFLKGEFVKQER